MPACANPHFSSLLAGEFRIRRPPPSSPFDATAQATPTFSADTQDPNPRGIFSIPHFLSFTFLAVVYFILCSSACTTPLAPGYRILKESREVGFVDGRSPGLRIRGNFTLQNIGNGELKFIDVAFPDEKVFGRRNLHARLDGRDATLS